MKEKIKSVIDDYTALVYKIQNAISRWSTILCVAYGDKNVYVEYYFLGKHVQQLYIPFEWFDLDDEDFVNNVKGILDKLRESEEV